MQKTSGHMSEFIDAQKPGLFDYIMRMTGNPGRAESALLSQFVSLSTWMSHPKTLMRYVWAFIKWRVNLQQTSGMVSLNLC